EGTDLGNRREVLYEASRQLESRAMRDRSGLGAVNQSYNIIRQRRQGALNMRNEYYDERMNRVSIANIQQINDRAYYRRGNRWVDSRVVENEAELKPKKVIEFGSEEFIELAYRLAAENRQGSIALGGDVLLLVEGEVVLVKMPSNN
ncbi:MAG: hypothetical protein KAV87_22680, partial [Desulfobacteraceae bacterium]|nr:hypothetical protein [Desulfobacteraceae bacterium]